MAYLGRNPAVGTQRMLDSLELQFNGVLTTFDLRYGGVPIYPTLSESLIVSLGGVLQEPGEAFNVSSDRIVFSEPPQAGAECWIMLYSQYGASVGSSTSTSIVQATGEPMGFEDRTRSSISFNTGSRTFSITPNTGGGHSSYVVWTKGTRRVASATQSVQIGTTTGLYYIYFDANGDLQYKTTYFTWDTETPVAYVYWNSTTSSAPFVADERHGVVLDWQTHEYLHRTRGAVIAEGFSVSNYTTTGNGNADAHAQFDLGNGTFFDEDLEVAITHSASPTVGTFTQVLQGAAEIPVFYMSGSSGAWVKDSVTEYACKQSGTTLQYNSLSGSTWSTTPAANNRYVISWIIATNEITAPVICVLGQEEHAAIGAAEAARFSDLILTNFPIVEFRPLWKVIFQTSTGFTNTPNALIANILDLRQLSETGEAGVLISDHGLLSGLIDDDHSQYIHTALTRTGVTAEFNTTGKITTTNRIGIGTTNPSSTADIWGLQANTGSTSASLPTGTLRLAFAGGENGGTYGSSLVFSQKWFTNTEAQVAVAQITGIKLAGNGNFGGGLTFFTSDGQADNLAERLRITSSGNVGIGTTNPLYKLDILGDINFTGTFYQNGSPFVASRWTSGTGDNIYRLNGSVGIGTTNPAARLDVKSQINLTNSTNTSRPALTGTYFGYSPSSYPVIQIGGVSAGYNTVSIGYDPSSNANGAFTGNGSEVVFRNGVKFMTPNNADNGWHLATLCMQDGNVGIGTANPDRTLYVNGPARIGGGADYGTTDVLSVAPGSVNFDANGVAGGRFKITSTGLVGINQPSPALRFSISEVGADITGGQAIFGTNMKGILLENSLNDNSSLGLWMSTSSHRAGISMQRSNYASTWGTDLRFYTHDDSSTNLTYAYERVRIGPNGNVGIGTTNPLTKLSVYSGSNDDGLTLEIGRTPSAGEGPAITLRHNTNNGTSQVFAKIKSRMTSGNDVSWGSSLSFFTGGNTLTENLTITGDGNVGIGTTGPASKLHVVGQTNLIAGGSGWDHGLNLYSADATNRWNFLVDNGDSDNLRLAYNNSERLRFATGGNMLVLAEIQATLFRDYNDNNYYANPGGTSRLNTLRIFSNSSADWDAIQISTDGASGYIQGLGDEVGLRLRSELGSIILADDRGNVGIGTTNPLSKLHVTGQLQTANPSTYSAITGINIGNNYPIYCTEVNAGSGGFTTFLLQRTVVNSGYRQVLSIGSYRAAGGTYTGGAYIAPGGGSDSTPTDYFLFSYQGALSYSGGAISFPGQIQSTQGNNVVTGGGQIYLNGSTGNRIDFNQDGVAPPALVGTGGATRSTGTKIVLYPGASASEADAGFGIESGSLWSSIWNTSHQFKWYAGTTHIATLFGTGEFAASSGLRTLGQVRATGWWNTPTGSSYSGLAVEMGMSAGNGYVLCYNRDSGAWGNLRIQGGNGSTQIELPPSGSTINITGSTSTSGNVRTNGDKLVLRDDSIEDHATNTDTGGVVINYSGYLSGGSRFRDFQLYNGKAGLILKAVGSSGNVGIGTTNPGYKLHVVGDINFTGSLYQNGSPFASASSTWVAGTGDNIYRLSGNVGIGTTNPGVPLDVRGVDSLIRASETGSGSAWRARIISHNPDAAVNKAVFLGTYGTSAGIFAHNAALNGWAPLFVNTTNGSSDGDTVILAGSGSVGIGTANPTSKLTVVGTVTATNFGDATGGYNVNLGSGSLEGRGLVAGHSGGSYGGIGYNVRHTTTGGTYIAPLGDHSSYLMFNQGFTFLGETGGAAGRTVSYSNLARLDNSGNLTQYVSGSHHRIAYSSGSDSYSSTLWWSGLALGNNGDNFIVAGRTSVGGSLKFYVNNTNDIKTNATPGGTLALTLASTANVGIGTDNPAYKLDVNGRSNFSDNMKITPTSEAWGEGLQFYMPTTSTWGGMRWVRNRTNYHGSWYQGWTALDSSNDMVFGHNASGTQIDNILRLYGSASGSARIGRDLYIAGLTGGSYGNRLIVGNTNTSYTLQDGNLRPTIQAHGAYPVLSLNHTVTGNSSHGPTIQFTCNGTGHQFVIGTTGNGARMDIGFSSTGDWNPHNGISGYQGTTSMSFATSGNVGIGTLSPAYKLEVNGSFAATTKSFVIPHPTKEGYKLRHGSLEGPENGVYVRGKSDSGVIELPEYWTGLVDPDSITVNLTPIGQNSPLWVERIEDNKVYVGREDTSVSYFYTVFAERIDVPTLDVEIKIEEDDE